MLPHYNFDTNCTLTNERIVPCDTKSNTRSANDGEDQSKPPAKGSLFGSNNSKDVFKVLWSIRVSTSLEEVNQIGLELIQLLQLGNIEKGSVSSDAKYKSLKTRWFGTNNDCKRDR